MTVANVRGVPEPARAAKPAQGFEVATRADAGFAHSPAGRYAT